MVWLEWVGLDGDGCVRAGWDQMGVGRSLVIYDLPIRQGPWLNEGQRKFSESHARIR
jgi:hypothetical protein